MQANRCARNTLLLAWRVSGAAQANASVLVGHGPPLYTGSSSPGLVADVQGWLNQPGSNHSRILVGDARDAITAKRVDCLQGATSSARPLLMEVVTSPVPEASTVLLFGVGLLSLLGLRRRNRFTGAAAASAPAPCAAGCLSPDHRPA